MKPRLSTLNDVLTVGVAVILLTGCGGPQPPIGAPVLILQSHVTSAHAGRKSWMLAEAKSDDLLYAPGGCDGTCVISYSGKVVGSIAGSAVQACSDKFGDVFLTGEPTISEYAHGGTTPIVTLTLPGQYPMVGGCAVDPNSGDLAVVYFCSGCGPSVAVFPPSGGTPKSYQADFDIQFCGYDNRGNLFVNGYANSGLGFAELPKGSSSFTDITIDPALQGWPWQVQWDGSYITYEVAGSAHSYYGMTIYRLKVSGSAATVVSETDFKGVTRTAAQSWIQGDRIFVPYGIRGDAAAKTRIGVWRYPSGGRPLESFKHLSNPRPTFQAVTVSVAPR
jgi:hypothetical protein